MKNKAPVFSEKEKKLLEDYRAKSSRMPRQNLVDFISHVDPGTAELGMNSGAYVMLDRIMTDEMIEFASHLKLRTPVYIEELAKMTGNSIEYTAKMADDLCRIGVLVYKPDDMGVDRVELPIFVVGMLEQLMLGGLDEDQFAEHPELPVGFTLQTTQTATKNGPLLPAANLGVHRPVPIESALKNETRVESWENLEHLIESCANGSYAIVDCICRKIRKAYGELGDDPELGWCMPIGYFADYAVRTGKGHYVTKEEYYAKLKEADERGYVHNVCNHEGKDYIEYVCNCDYQSCMSLRAALYTGAYNMQKSNFVATVDASKCVACGSCVEKCPANAVRLGQKLGQKHKTEYASKPLPNETNQLVWGEEHYDPLYLLHRSSIREETGTAPCKVNCPAHIAVQGYLRMAAQVCYTWYVRPGRTGSQHEKIPGLGTGRGFCVLSHIADDVSSDQALLAVAILHAIPDDALDLALAGHGEYLALHSLVNDGQVLVAQIDHAGVYDQDAALHGYVGTLQALAVVGARLIIDVSLISVFFGIDQ